MIARCALLLLFIATFQGLVTADKKTINGKELVNLGGRNYYFSPQDGSVATYYGAQAQCTDIGMVLLSLEDLVENAVISQYFYDTVRTQQYWTSGHKVANDWVWEASGSHVTYTNWDDGEPNSPANDKCICTYAPHARWHDNPCDNEYHYICEQV